MSETSNSLLERLRQGPNEAAWRRMVDLYTPLIRGWLRRYALADTDCDDLVQDVLAIVVRRLPDFQRRPQVGSFRRWLRNITVNCLRDFWRSQRFKPRTIGNTDFGSILAELEDPQSALSKRWDAEHDHHVTACLLEKIRPRFEAKTWQAFRRVALDGSPVDQVASELGLTANAVFIAKSRVVHMLRKEGLGLLD
ncbi:MAG TPA: sigma-70 family RNA polymerase sigma factor [Gemmataceae bacterium]|nr:sigma-70 family RNA polymerase sigma factor [Gemmataceae bacterium]